MPCRPTARDDSLLYVRGLSLEEIEREAIRLSLRRNGGRRSAVVRELRIAKSTVLKRITQWGLQDEGRAPASRPGRTRTTRPLVHHGAGDRTGDVPAGGAQRAGVLGQVDGAGDVLSRRRG